MPGMMLWGWDGTKWLPVLCDTNGILRQDQLHHSIVTVRITATGVVSAAPCYLHWISINPSGPNSAVVLTDSLAALATATWGYTKTAKDSDHREFNPAIKFSVGLYVETLTSVTAIYLAYDFA